MKWENYINCTIYYEILMCKISCLSWFVYFYFVYFLSTVLPLIPCKYPNKNKFFIVYDLYLKLVLKALVTFNGLVMLIQLTNAVSNNDAWKMLINVFTLVLYRKPNFFLLSTPLLIQWSRLLRFCGLWTAAPFSQQRGGRSQEEVTEGAAEGIIHL